jgi:hypothetical protein
MNDPSIERLAAELIYGTPLPPAFNEPDLSDDEVAIIEAMSVEQKLTVGHLVKLVRIAARLEMAPALRRAVDTIRALHGIGLNGPAEAGVWELYQQSPEMQQINAAIARAEGRS